MIFTIALLATDLPIVVYFLVFYATKIRLITLRKYINNENFNINKTQFLYKYLIDSVENIKTIFDHIFIITLMTNIPDLMVSIYIIIRQMKFGTASTLAYAAEFLTTTMLFLKMFAPAIEAGLLSTEIYKIKVILHDKLLVEEELNRFINYVEVRPFKFNVIKIINLDATFPVAVLNLCITYLIISLQLTHFY
ncbi:uncharacterized protein LOC124539106 [Vanessa cardui]|uniref:uncharacterized protein LOC124539106 n=1 Tax=Vanessa cardui TaxID=171605 RepID=UPI001F12E5C3|nr:uncharacterized protein LOC124539106 [Vanessa cardui]